MRLLDNHALTDTTTEVASRHVTIADIWHAYKFLKPIMHHTPLTASRTMSEKTGADIYLKAEHMQRGGSFPNLQGFATARSAGRLQRHSHAGTLARAGVGPVVCGNTGGSAARGRVGCSVGIADAIAQPNRGPDANSLCDTLT